MKKTNSQYLPKRNRIFTQDPKVLEFIDYYKNKYSQNIRNIEIRLYDEKDAKENEWQIWISECSENNKQGMSWVPWQIREVPSFLFKKRVPPKNKRYKLSK